MEADVRRSVRALGATQGGGSTRRAEETFFGGLWAARQAAKAANLDDDDDDDEGQRRGPKEDSNHASESEWREKRNARRANEILRAFEFNFRREGHARAAETLDACLEYLSTSYTGDALPSVLTLLSMLARSHSEDPVSHSSRRVRHTSQVVLSDTADRLLAASSAIAHGHASLAPQASQMPMNSETPGMDSNLIRTVSLTPSAQRLLGTSTDGPATTLRLRVQTRTSASELKRYPLLPLDETSWAEAAENGCQVFRRLQGDNDITEEKQWGPSMNLERLTMEPTSRPAKDNDPQNMDENSGNALANTCEDFLEPLPSKDCLLGALVSQTRSNLSEVNITLSLPELDTEYDGFAPDPLGLKIAQDRDLASLKQQRIKGKQSVQEAAESKLRYPYSASENLDETANSSDFLLCEVRWPPEEDLWLRLAHTAHPLPPRLLLGWEEEVAASFKTSVPHDECSKALQYSSHAVLSSERGPMWLEHLIQHSGRFERSRGATVISAQELQRDLVYALLGVPSRSFELHEDPLRLEPCETRLLAGTVEGLGSVLDQVAACGSTYLALASLCKGDPILPEAEVAEVVVERIDAHLLAHQRRVGLLFQSASQSEHDVISLLEISHRIEMSLAPPLRRLRALFAVPRASVTTIQTLEHFHASALASGASLRSMERGMLWCCLERVVDVLAGWSFGGADAFEHFDGCFFRHATTGDEASSKDGSSPSHEALLAAVTEKRLLYALHLPSFCKSSLRGVSSLSLARRATRCGALLRLLRGMPNCAELYELCTRKTDQDAFRLDALRAGNGANATFLQKVLHESSERKQHLIAKVAEHCNESEKKRFLEQEARRKEAWKVIEDSRIAAEAVNARFIARSEEEQRRIEAERKAQLEEFRAAAEDAKSAKVRARLEKQRQEREEQPRDLTSLITDEQRTEAEHYLLEQFERLAQEQAEQGGVLDAKLAAAKHELETKLASLQTASQDSFQRSDATTSVVVQQPPGGRSVAASLLYGNGNATGRSRSAVHIVGRAEDGMDARAAISNEPLARDHSVKTSVHIVNHAEEGADARAAISNEPLPADVDARSSVQIVKRDKEEGADARAAISDEPLASSPDARTSVQIVKRDKEEGADARAAISDEPLASSPNARTSVQIVKRDKEEGADARAAISDEPLASSPNARTSVQIVKRDKEEGADARAAISDEPLASSPNARTSVQIVKRDNEEGADARAAISDEPLASSPNARTSVQIAKRDKEEGADARAAISDEPLASSPNARTSVQIVKRDKEEGADARAAISDEPLVSSPNARTSVRIVKRDKEEGVDARAAISDEPLAAGVNAQPMVHIVGSVSPQASKTVKPSVRVQQSPGGETSFAFGVHPDATRPAVQVNQPAGGHSTIEALMTRTNRFKSEESECDAMESLARRQKTVRSIRDAMVSAKPLRYGDAILSDVEECRQPPGGAAKQAILDSLEDLGCDDAPCGALDAAIELAIVEPLLQQCDLVEATFVAVVVRQSNVLEALDGVRSTILMAQGDLYNGIVDRLYEMRLRDGDLRHRKGRVLQEVFASEADGLGLTERPFASHFHYAVDVTSEAAHSGHSEFSKFAFVNAHYELHWPLSFIVREQDKAAYPQIHRFLLQLKYAGALVRRVWTRLCATRALGRLPILTWLSTRWHQVRNLISNLEDYLMTTLLTEHWAAMQTAFGAPCASFRHPHELQEIHHRFVEAALRTCFLDGSNVSKVLHECVSRAMERTDALARHSLHLLDELLDGAETNVQRHEDTKVPRELEQAWREFSKTQTFLLRTVQSYSRSALSSDGAAQRILVHLNFNCFFSSA